MLSWLAKKTIARNMKSMGLQIYPDEVIPKGFPWRQTICVRGHIHLNEYLLAAGKA